MNQKINLYKNNRFQCKNLKITLKNRLKLLQLSKRKIKINENYY